MRNTKQLPGHPNLQLLNSTPLPYPMHCLSMSDGGAELQAVIGLATEDGECQAATGHGKHVLKKAGRT